ncbi:hypothetical protein FH115_07075 [Staphylococcus hominis]|uniref:hypothetical protein n=1 Tax=Staphylococcus hominis TaxID=1290 RepID=UPI001F58CB7C|nr:hypothetical protein [Staphylococcus hominis]MCI2869446.1 hypothetical protein [Staphylococcus hominis]MDS3893793.1 hypothetical protein [Staphylococcus hominis]
MENKKVDDKDIKLALQKKQIDEQSGIIINLQVQIEKLYRENQELNKPQSE